MAINSMVTSYNSEQANTIDTNEYIFTNPFQQDEMEDEMDLTVEEASVQQAEIT